MGVPFRFSVVAVMLLAIAPFDGLLAQARIVEWVENAPASDADKIALGYPVPIPVDTPLPFAGYRTGSDDHGAYDLAVSIG